MQYRRLGRTGLEVSVVGIGTWQYGGEWGATFAQADVDAIFDRARDLGVDLVDTAECYGDHTSEELVGAAVARDRDRWVLATKFGHRFTGLHQREDLWSPGEVVAQLERSLRALRTDRVDVYQFHSGPDDAFDQDDLWDVLRSQVDAGKIRHLGISIGARDDVHQTGRATQVGADVLQVAYSRLDREPEDGVLPSSLEQDLGVLVREPLAGGLLTGKYPPGTTFTDPADTRSQRPDDEVQRRLEAAAVIQRDEVPGGAPMATWALAWCLQHPAVAAVIPGSKSVEQLDGNAAAADLDLVRADHPLAVAG